MASFKTKEENRTRLPGTPEDAPPAPGLLQRLREAVAEALQEGRSECPVCGLARLVTPYGKACPRCDLRRDEGAFDRPRESAAEPPPACDPKPYR